MPLKPLNNKSKVAWIVSIILFLLIVHIIFKLPAPYPWLEAVWSAGDLITFIGTMFLGGIAVYQSTEANDASNRLQKIEEASLISIIALDELEITPYSTDCENATTAEHETIDLCEEPDDKKYEPAVLQGSFANKSSYPIVAISVHCGEKRNDAAGLCGIKTINEQAIYIDANEVNIVRIIIPTVTLRLPNEGNLITNELSIYCKFINIFGYPLEAKLCINDIHTRGRLAKSDYTYRISLISDIKPKKAQPKERK